VKLEGEPAASMKLGQKSCVIKSISAYTLTARSLVKHSLKRAMKLLAYTLSAQSLVKHPLKGNEASDRITLGHKCGSKHNKRYNSTGLLADNSWFIYRYCTEWIEYAGLV
jgi:hypothetical protein